MDTMNALRPAIARSRATRGTAARRMTVRRPAARARAPALLLLLGALLALGACQKDQRRATTEESLARSIAVINNEKVLYEDFLNQYQLFLTRWDRFIQNDPQKKQEIKDLLLQRVVDSRLIDQEAHRKGIEVDDAELNKRALELLGSAEEAEASAAEGVLPNDSLGDWTRELRRRLVHEKVVQQEVVAKIRITPAEMRAYYDRHRESFYRAERVKVRHIAVGSRSLFNRVMGLLGKDHDFVELVRQYSITPDRFSNGELGFVERGVLPREFDAAIFKMARIGSVTPANSPVQTEMGYHIFRLEGREPEGQLSFRDALPEIRQRLLHEKQAEAYQRWLANLHQKSTIVIDDALLNAE
jgi:parvulin-like peptidyl-prolyl isomerase